MNITYDEKTKELTIKIKLPDKPAPSKTSGKLNNCGGSGGFVVTPATVQGKPVKVSVNAII